MAEALRELRVRLHDVPPDVPFQVDARTLKLGTNFTFDTDIENSTSSVTWNRLGRLTTCKRTPSSSAPYWRFLVIALDAPLRIKQPLGRPKDTKAAAQLLAIKRQRGTSPSRAVEMMWNSHTLTLISAQTRYDYPSRADVARFGPKRR